MADRNQNLSEALFGWGKESHRIIMGKGRHHVLSAVFDYIFIIHAGNDNIHNSLYDFKIRPDLTTDYGVS